MGSHNHDFEKGEEHKKAASRPLIYAILAGAVLVALGLALGLGLGLRSLNTEQEEVTVTATTSTPSVEEAHSATGTYRYASVASDSKICSEIGIDIMARKGGSAVDAAIASMLCTGLVHRHSAGIGGGFFMTIYNRTSETVNVLDARERAPLLANQTMYINRTDGLTSTLGGLAIAVPGEIKGYWEAHQRYGRLPWRDLFQPAIKLCREGVPVYEPLSVAINRYPDLLKNFSHSMYFDATTGEPVKVGEKVKLPLLADTLNTIAEGGQSAFYNGSLTDIIVNETRRYGGIISREDLNQYNATWRTPLSVTLRDNLTLYSVPPPGSGAVYEYIMNILDGYGFTPDSLSTNEKSVLTYHRIVEAMKFAYAKRTDLGDEDFVDVAELIQNMTSRDYADSIRAKINDFRTEDTDFYGPTFYDSVKTGTTHTSIIDAQGNAVAITSTINTYFGSKVRGNTTGIAYNNEMDDFSTPGEVNYFGVPASPANFIEPRKRPLSSMCPSIVIDSNTGDVVLAVGAAGGTKITTSTMLVSLYTLRLGLPVGAAIDSKRLHHQLLPKTLSVEKGFPQEILDGLKAKGHNLTLDNPSSVVDAIHVTGGMLHAASDIRKFGAPDGY
ncbi:glutathione hydrolase 1 proenzyme-like [Haliotis rufescens]|uniref:glutathione hydrolase 1 proenzyme-like n=1 Tax=Haliotis rufescens TaxID=6454 RepID=UPI00201ED75C|nr:glutathione hydrolase 1 proenzyme-like [Haliotis rufescens]XP_046333063.2 glutathione hydrolase 1 proenzyme-like [Haliotis rufescens]XP_046333064.2 glutathione hydrolase 1 proenzyme-like [Haliotis rufescens]